MAASILPRPGTKYGPCKNECKHVDCKHTRKDAAQLCTLCQKPIGYGVRYYRDDANQMVHARCFEEAIEREMMME